MPPRQVDHQWQQRLAALSNLIAVAGNVFASLVAIGLIAIVGNTIKLAIENKKQEVRVIKLVGGTDVFIARPFLYTGLFYGLAGDPPDYCKCWCTLDLTVHRRLC